MRKQYSKPEVRAEHLVMGVFGSYSGGNDTGGNSGSGPINFINPLFRICCS